MCIFDPRSRKFDLNLFIRLLFFHIYEENDLNTKIILFPSIIDINPQTKKKKKNQRTKI